jgi:thioredoxin-like negative regulator of GroEL
MAPVVAEIALENRNTFAVAKLNIKNARQTLQKYPIRATPTYMVFQDGKRVGKTLTRAQPKAQLLQEILSAINN